MGGGREGADIRPLMYSLGMRQRTEYRKPDPLCQKGISGSRSDLRDKNRVWCSTVDHCLGWSSLIPSPCGLLSQFLLQLKKEVQAEWDVVR